MCFHYSLTQKAKALKARFNIEELDDEELAEYLHFHANGFAHPKMPVITHDEPHRLQFFTWGLIPSWNKDQASAKKIWNTTLNARSETIFEKPSFRYAAKHKRCLVLADGFFEFHTEGKKKQPHFIYLHEHAPFAFGGLWETWTDKQQGETIHTFSIVTTRANELVANIHNEPTHSLDNRMPLILSPQNEPLWLSAGDESSVQALALSYPSQAMQHHTVSHLITSRKENTNVAAVQMPDTSHNMGSLF
ncbi:MAG: SOS response-associated peptidase [Bacteroidetes bacterium]|jgi:putative SOS response-associated peptidase YedK|nr:SOS response-associated peptidase [Bacteroidota bacterium]MBK7042136.1 SOS response-associated peptidase [Bacteroidota bacterium]MBK9299797.1 SOS response-associated peptidase [Bacteroidota bacterium]MBK9481100.1 SOS response-associated peptidase [Bacteroidota bacterium]